ncbi:MAG: hypothetical protein PHT28_01980 [Dehalococcoidales bacterium]|jgi:hypothetical protein|nr:hypothetical protein [Dehalococcoidales bacterium]MDD4230190.1 hypothetical protein [Dehalococcoidales bacterium]MDD4465853.1 hypothetical protein [Dehalococcoidales bacterium]MDD5401754.1 hypothetical protein [Dehalococcoidales bacterium]
MTGEAVRAPKYYTGQRVIIQPVAQERTPGDAAIEPYAGKIATVEDYYYIYSPDRSQVFYIYTVRLTSEDKNELVAHEDELKPVFE